MTGSPLDAVDPFAFLLSIFVMAVFVGYYVVWSVTPALHTPLMSVTSTDAPAAASASETAAPIPAPAPVTNAERPVRSK